jgi:hypothetical protein
MIALISFTFSLNEIFIWTEKVTEEVVIAFSGKGFPYGHMSLYHVLFSRAFRFVSSLLNLSISNAISSVISSENAIRMGTGAVLILISDLPKAVK